MPRQAQEEISRNGEMGPAVLPTGADKVVGSRPLHSECKSVLPQAGLPLLKGVAQTEVNSASLRVLFFGINL